MYGGKFLELLSQLRQRIRPQYTFSDIDYRDHRPIVGRHKPATPSKWKVRIRSARTLFEAVSSQPKAQNTLFFRRFIMRVHNTPVMTTLVIGRLIFINKIVNSVALEIKQLPNMFLTNH
jgi:hypothetical protein